MMIDTKESTEFIRWQWLKRTHLHTIRLIKVPKSLHGLKDHLRTKCLPCVKAIEPDAIPWQRVANFYTETHYPKLQTCELGRRIEPDEDTYILDPNGLQPNATLPTLCKSFVTRFLLFLPGLADFKIIWQEHTLNPRNNSQSTIQPRPWKPSDASRFIFVTVSTSALADAAAYFSHSKTGWFHTGCCLGVSQLAGSVS